MFLSGNFADKSVLNINVLIHNDDESRFKENSTSSTSDKATINTSAWNLLLVNSWNKIPEDFSVKLTQLKKGHSVDERVTPDLQAMLDDMRAEGLGFKTPPTDSKGANHILEHALLCGSEKYPTKNIMNYINNGTSSLLLNGVTSDDFTYYLINTKNQTEYFNMIDVYMDGIFHPLFLTDKNIFRQQGIRLEYTNGKAQYNGVVYNELRIKNLNTDENSLSFIANKLYKSIYGDTTPSFSASGELDAIKKLTYEDLLKV